jgi:hypothetical protein
LTFAELVERTGDPPHLLRFVLAQEIAVGRVAWTADGRYALDPATFPRDVLAGLRALSAFRSTDVGEVDRTLPAQPIERDANTSLAELAIAGAEDTG